MGESKRFDVRAVDLTVLEQLASQTQKRAANVRRHAIIARDQARRDHARGDDQAETLHLREAEAHDAAARAIEQTAQLYRHRLRRLGA